MKRSRKVILYIATSLDGFIAGPNDDLSFLSRVQIKDEDYGYADFGKTIDTVIMGRKTFDWVTNEIKGLPHPNLDTYVITRTKRPDIGKTKFYTGSLPGLINQLQEQPGKHIFCDGGGEVVHNFLKHKLIDEMIISIIPALLGNGTRLFHEGRPEQLLNLIDSKPYPSGLVQLHYKINY